MELSGAEILVRSLAAHNVDTIFGYPGSCVMHILDKLSGNVGIDHILMRHEQGAVFAACGYARLSGKPGVVLVTSGPGATNTVSGIADAFSKKIPLLVITGQVSSALLGTDAFQEADMINLTASITKWNCQVCRAEQIASAVSKAFKIAMSHSPGPVLLDITKDAQSGKTEYDCNEPDSDNYLPGHAAPYPLLPEGRLYTKIIKILKRSGKDVVLIVDKMQDHDNPDKHLCGYETGCGIFDVPGSGLPAAIGAKYAVPLKTVCLLTGSPGFQPAIRDMGVIMQEGIEVKIIVINESSGGRSGIKNPDFMQLIRAYGIQGDRINVRSDLSAGIYKMLDSTKSYLLEIEV